MSFLFGFTLVMPAMAGFFGNSKELLREAVGQKKWEEVASKSQKLLDSNSGDGQKDVLRLVQAIGLQRQGKIDESIKVLEPITEQSPYFSWAKVFLTRLAYASNKTDLLKSSLQSLDRVTLKGELKLEKRFYEAHLNMETQKWSSAGKILKQLEKPSRGTELHIPVLEALALADSNSQKITAVCKTIIKLYTKYPKHLWFTDVAPEIKNIHLGEKRFSCAVTSKDFEARRKKLNLMGEFKIASDELQKWFRLAGMSFKQQKIMQAQQMLSEGHPEEAVVLLKSTSEKGNDLQVLIPLSFAAARAGDMNLAIESSLKVHKLSGFSKQGNMALYQAAAWAYQTRDYDNAEIRFRQLKLNRLSRAHQKEVRWYLGWIRYLKGDYNAAEKSFRTMQKSVGRKAAKESPDRIQYWLAMSLLKQEKPEKARVLFQKLLSKKGMNYYSFLARERVKQIPEKNQLAEKSDETIQLVVIGRSVYFTPFGEEAPRPNDQEAQATEEEISSSESDESSLLAEEATSNDNGEDDKVSEESETVAVELFSQGEANQKLERAKAFWSVGLEDLARREVGDLERYSRSFDLFKKITEEYRQMGLYNKMSVLGQSYSGRANMTNNKFVLEAIYPRAYSDFVEKYSLESNVARSLIWGMMKAESMYRPWVKSPVGALGLMQVMPLTGQKLSEMLEVKSFTPQMLLQPQDAIRFGSKYLERLGKKFDHSVQLVAAAYNAGPHRVSQWLYYFGYMQMDEWVEHIPFLETRNYVKKVTSNYMAYNELYGKSLGDTLALIDPVPVQIAGAPETKENWE